MINNYKYNTMNNTRQNKIEPLKIKYNKDKDKFNTIDFYKELLFRPCVRQLLIPIDDVTRNLETDIELKYDSDKRCNPVDNIQRIIR